MTGEPQRPVPPPPPPPPPPPVPPHQIAPYYQPVYPAPRLPQARTDGRAQAALLTASIGLILDLTAILLGATAYVLLLDALLIGLPGLHPIAFPSSISA